MSGRTTIMLPDELDVRLRREAKRRSPSIADVAREAIDQHVPPSRPEGRLSFFALGQGSPPTPPSGSTSVRRGARAPSRPALRVAMLIIDAGPLYAAAATRDKHHRRCVELLTRSPGPLLVPALVVTEVSYLLCDRIGPHAEHALARAIRDGELAVEPVLESDWPRIES